MAGQRVFGYTRILSTGAPAPGATITVYDAGTLNLSTIFADSLGTPKANPFVADGNGYFFFYGLAGPYDIQFSGAGIAFPYSWPDVALPGTVIINGGLGITHLFGVGTAGNDFAIVTLQAGNTWNHTWNLPDAGAAKRGVVTTGAQTFAGVKTFNIPIAAGSGGTGIDGSAAPNGTLLIGNGGAGYTLAWLTGTANQVNVANAAGSITLSLPQSIHTAATPLFAGLTLSGLTNRSIVITNTASALAVINPLDGEFAVGRGGFLEAPGRCVILAGAGITATFNPVSGAGLSDWTIALTTTVVTSLNGSTTGVQTFAVTATGSDFTISTAAGVHTFALPDASPTARGLLTFSAQTLGGVKSFNATPKYAPGSSAIVGPLVSGRFFSDTTSHGNTLAAETDLSTTTIKASSFTTQGQAYRVTAWGNFAANANTKTLRIYLGATAVSLFASVASGSEFRVVVDVIWVAHNSWLLSAQVFIGTTLALVRSTYAVDETADLTLKTTGQSSAASSNDLTQVGLVAEFVGV